MGPDEVEPLEETVEVLDQAAALRDIAESEAAVTAGDTVSAGELRTKYLRE